MRNSFGLWLTIEMAYIPMNCTMLLSEPWRMMMCSVHCNYICPGYTPKNKLCLH